MKEIPAKAILEAYNKKYDKKVTMKEVVDFLQTNAFYNLSADFAASRMHRKLEGK